MSTAACKPGKRHSWQYFGGCAKCKHCGKFVQPDGRVTKTPHGRAKKRSK